MENQAQNPQNNPNLLLPAGNPKSKYWKFILGFLGVIIGVFVLYAVGLWGWQSFKQWQGEKKAEEIAQKIKQLEQEDYKRAMADTYGGKTPQETLQMYIDAVEKGDYELASKYFIGDYQEKELESSRKMPSNEIQKYIDTNKMEILLDSVKLNNLIAKNIKQAQEDKSHLEKALKLYNSAEGFYKQVSYEVIKTGSMPFVKILEDIYERLNSENVCSLLITRKWKEYNDVINTTIEILNDLHEQATNYQDEGYEKERTIYTEETDEEKAYRILGVPFTATNERIKNVWKATFAAWHPDGKEGKEKEEREAQCKEINWAYDVLKRERNIT